MKKKIIVPLFLILSFVFLTVFTVASYADDMGDKAPEYVTDKAGLLTEDERLKIDDLAEEVSNKHGVGVYIVTIPDMKDIGYDDSYECASYIYNYSGYHYGLGNDLDGVMLFLSLADRDYALYAYGPLAKDTFNRKGISSLEDAFLDDLKNDFWENGFYDYVNTADMLLSGKTPFSIVPIIGNIGIACIISLIICLLLKSRMKTAKRAKEAFHYISDGGFNLSGSYDRYTYTTRTERKIEKSSDKDTFRSGNGGVGSSGKF